MNIKAGYLQFKPVFGKPEINIARIKNLLKGKKFDLIVLPELANSGYLFSNKKELYDSSEEIPGGIFVNALWEISSKKKCHIVSGICERSGNKFYNSSVLVYPSGNVKVYRKLHLFDTEKKWFEPGNYPPEVHEIRLQNSGKVKTGMLICFDWIFPETARTLALKGAQILCHPSNLVMPYCQKAMFTRALENQVFTITSNRIGKESNGKQSLWFTGQSVIVSPKGKYLAFGSRRKEECVIAEINPKDALNKKINPSNDLFKDRRRKYYKI